MIGIATGQARKLRATESPKAILRLFNLTGKEKVVKALSSGGQP
jgi:hypothetical protein